jgi:hypothetical protein
MYKILDLGSEITSTGERRVTVLDGSLVKTASNAIQDYWHNLEREEGKSYLLVLAMTAIGWYSCNNNGDAFTEEDLKKYHQGFVTDANIFKHHVNKDPAKSLGKVVFAFYNDNMHRVELVLAVDKAKTPEIVKAIENDEPIAVSMGVRVKYDKCSICGNQAKTRAQYCDCLKYNMKKILPDGRQVYALNPGPLKFFDISIVRKPADQTAWALRKVAGDQAESYAKSSAERGEEYLDTQEKLAALTKLSDIIKEVEGTPVKAKDGDSFDEFAVHKHLRDQLENGAEHVFDLPQLSFEDMAASGARAGDLLRAVVGMGALPSLGESAFMVGRHFLGDDLREQHICQMLQGLPRAITLVKRRPDFMEEVVQSLLSDVTSCQNGNTINININMTPVRHRARMMSKFANAAECQDHVKIASDVVRRLNTSGETFRKPKDRLPLSKLRRDYGRYLRTDGPAASRELTITGLDGKKYRTTQAEARAANSVESITDTVRGVTGAGLAMAALGAILSKDSLAAKMILTPVLAGSAAAMLSSGPRSVETEQGVEVPAQTLFTQVKEAGITDIAKLDPLHIGAILGSTLPAAAGVDYLFNKHVKYKDDPYYKQRMGLLGRTADSIGKTVMDHPLTMVSGGAVLGAMTPKALPKAVGSAYREWKSLKGK